MNPQEFKICPRCGQRLAMHMPACGRCGAVFSLQNIDRTIFFQSQHSGKSPIWPLLATLVLLAVVVAIFGIRKYNESHSFSSDTFSDLPESYSYSYSYSSAGMPASDPTAVGSQPVTVNPPRVSPIVGRWRAMGAMDGVFTFNADGSGTVGGNVNQSGTLSGNLRWQVFGDVLTITLSPSSSYERSQFICTWKVNANNDRLTLISRTGNEDAFYRTN